MTRTDHPVVQKTPDRWLYSQPQVGLHCSYATVDLETEKVARHSLTTLNTCREGIIHDIRTKLQKEFCKSVKVGPNAWDMGFERKQGILLDQEEDLGPKKNFLKIYTVSYLANLPEAAVFSQAMDTVLGIACVLLDPTRPTGDWWETPEEDVYQKARKDGREAVWAYWYGPGNFCLQHPALVAIITGLYRQVALLCNAGFAEDIIAAADHDRVREAITNCDWREALSIASDIRPWIEVPVGKHGHAINYPFPLGYWQRFMRLQRGSRRHGYEKVFGQDFIEGWALENKSSAWTGLYGLWGEKGKLTNYHRRLMDLGKPLKRRKNGSKSAQATS